MRSDLDWLPNPNPDDGAPPEHATAAHADAPSDKAASDDIGTVLIDKGFIDRELLENARRVLLQSPGRPLHRHRGGPELCYCKRVFPNANARLDRFSRAIFIM